MTRDEELGRTATRMLGLEEEFFELLSIISVNRTPNSKASLGESMSEEVGWSCTCTRVVH